ncbi:MAG TPA: hypothetical protein VIT90_14260 [Lysobacter sp.]
MTFVAWLASLVALLTSLAMLKDTYLGETQRAEFRAILGRAWTALRLAGPMAVNRPELSRAVRSALRAAILVLIVASSGVCVFLPGAGGHCVGEYDVALRCALAAFLAMQAPCPWWRYIVHGERRADAPSNQGGGRVH